MSLRIYFLFSACLLAVEKCLIHIGEKWDLCSSASSSLCGFFFTFSDSTFFLSPSFLSSATVSSRFKGKIFSRVLLFNFSSFFREREYRENRRSQTKRERRRGMRKKERKERKKVEEEAKVRRSKME